MEKLLKKLPWIGSDNQSFILALQLFFQGLLAARKTTLISLKGCFSGRKNAHEKCEQIPPVDFPEVFLDDQLRLVHLLGINVVHNPAEPLRVLVVERKQFDWVSSQKVVLVQVEVAHAESVEEQVLLKELVKHSDYLLVQRKLHIEPRVLKVELVESLLIDSHR